MKKTYRITSFGRNLAGRHGITGVMGGLTMENVLSHQRHSGPDNLDSQYLLIDEEVKDSSGKVISYTRHYTG